MPDVIVARSAKGASFTYLCVGPVKVMVCAALFTVKLCCTGTAWA